MYETLNPSRRAFVTTASAAVVAAWLAPGRSFAAVEAPASVVDSMRRDSTAATLELKALRGNVSVISGSGGNITVLNGPDGKLLVDAGIARQNVEPTLARIGNEPPRYVVNTHFHFDHTDGNAWLHGAGATIVAHANTRKRLATSTRVEAWNHTFPPSPRGALPTAVLTDAQTLLLNDATVQVTAFAPSHTDGDVRVTFVEADVVAMGDVYWNGHYPFIDYSNGGSIDGTIGGTETTLNAIGDNTMVVPGHGPVSGKRELTEYRDMLRTVRDAVAKLKRQGRSVDEAIAARPTAAFDAKWGTFVIGPDIFTRLVYAGV